MKNSVPIDQAGRIVLPKNVRQELAIKPGDVFKISVCGTAVTLTPDKETSGFIRNGKALVFSARGGKMLGNAAVGAILEEGRREHHDRIETGIRGRKRQP
jgi:AbrB family looped-hinge helix DNA binding protein